MPVASADLFIATFALIGAVIVVSALLSGVAERTGLPGVIVFLSLGALIGVPGLGLIDIRLDSAILRAVASVSLVLVLFTDAISLNIKELRANKFLASLVLGPGTLLSAALIGVVAHWLLGLSVPMAAIVGAALASTDPVLLRPLLRRDVLDPSVRQALRFESGMNDAVLLPVVLVAMSVLEKGRSLTGNEWVHLALNILLLSPAAGVAVGLAGIGMLEFVRRRTGVRRDYESIYSLGLALAAFAAAEAVHGSGFLAAFAAGLTISALDVELCDCFLEYGETTAELALVFTFVLFGTSVIWTGLELLAPATIMFTVAVFLARPAAFVPALLPARISWRNRALIAWFGPRGLSSLLLVLLPVFAGLPGSESLLTLCCLVVLFSVLTHGVSPVLLSRKPKPESSGVTPPEYITIEQIEEPGTNVLVADSRTDRAYTESGQVIPGSIRLHPDHAVPDAERLQVSKHRVLAVLCA